MDWFSDGNVIVLVQVILILLILNIFEITAVIYVQGNLLHPDCVGVVEPVTFNLFNSKLLLSSHTFLYLHAFALSYSGTFLHCISLIYTWLNLREICIK